MVQSDSERSKEREGFSQVREIPKLERGEISTCNRSTKQEGMHAREEGREEKKDMMKSQRRLLRRMSNWIQLHNLLTESMFEGRFSTSQCFLSAASVEKET